MKRDDFSRARSKKCRRNHPCGKNKPRRTFAARFEVLEPRHLLAGPAILGYDPHGLVDNPVSRIVLDLSGPVVGNDARDAANYSLTYLGADRALGGGDDRSVRIVPRYLDGANSIELAAAADLSRWTEVDYGFPAGVLGNWQLLHGGTAVKQLDNGGTTFFVSDFDLVNSQFLGRLRVDDPAADDDFVGFVFGFRQNPDTGLPESYYLVSWKQTAQGEAEAGVKLARVTGTGLSGNRPDLWNLEATDPHIQILASDPAAGWQAGMDYDFQIGYQADGTIDLSIRRATDGQAVWNVHDTDPAPLGPGKVGFYNFSQPGVSYTDLNYTGSLPDGYYQVTARSGSPGLRDADGNALDGNNDGTAGGDFVAVFAVDTTAPELTSVGYLNGRIKLAFSDLELDAATVTDPAHYRLWASGGDGAFENGNDLDATAAIKAVVYDAATMKATVILSTLPSQQETYRIAVSGVKDKVGHTIDPLAHGDFAVDNTSGQRQFNVAIGIMPSVNEDPDPNYWQIISTHGLKPDGWSFANPHPNVPGAPWRTNVGQLPLDALLDYDLVFISNHYQTTFSAEDNAKLSQWVAAGGTIWIDNCGGMDPQGFFVPFSYVYDGFPADGAKITDAPTHPFFNSVYPLSSDEISHLGTPGWSGRITSYDANTWQVLVSNSSGNERVADLALLNHGFGRVVVTSDDYGCEINDTNGNQPEDVKLVYNILNWAQDTLEPNTTILGGPAEGTTIAARTADFQWAGYDDSTPLDQLQFSWRLDGGQWSSPAAGRTLALADLADGPHTLEVRARDLAGNLDPSPAVRHFRVDATGPVISGASESPGERSCLVVWTTDEPGISRIEYGPDAAYGSATPLDSRLVTNHGVPLAGLAPNTAYHYRILTRDAVGNESASADRVFTTLPDLTPPSVITFSPVGLVNQDLRTMEITFSEEMLAASFAADDVTIIGPAGPVDRASIIVAPISAVKFQIDLAAQSAEGHYTITIGPAITDLAGNLLSAPFSALVTLDKTGPAVTAMTPSGTVGAVVDHVDVIISEPIRAASFSTADVQLVGPAGPVAVTQITALDGTTYRLSFAPQRTNGDYAVTIGPDILDLAGNRMVEAFSGAFTIALPDLGMETVSPGSASGIFGETRTVSWTVTNSGAAAAGGWTDKVYLSRTATLDSSAIRLASVASPSPLVLPYTASTQVTLPLDHALTAGTYYLIVQADAGQTLTEANETNNATASTAVDLAFPPAPDLVPGAVASAGVALPGSQVLVSWTVANQGTAVAAGPWTETVYLSSDASIGDDKPVASFTYAGPLAPGDPPVTRNELVTIPAYGIAGSTRFVVRVDSAAVVYELDEENNAAIAETPTTVPAILTLAPPPGLIHEGGNTPSIRGVVSRSGDLGQPLIVSLSSNDATELTVPATVTIPAGQQSVAFVLTAVADGVPDGPQQVTVAAQAAGYTSSQIELSVLDVDKPSLALVFDVPEVRERMTITATVTRDFVSDNAALVFFSTPSPGQLTLPDMVTIDPGQASVTFEVTATNDQVPEQDELVRVTAYAVGYKDGAGSVKVIDDDEPTLTLELSAATISEGAGAAGLRATVRRAVATDVELQVRLTSSDATEAAVPAEVVIAAGATTVDFWIAAVDDATVDGPQSVTISAAGIIPACGCSTSPGGTGTTTAAITVTDDDGPTLRVVIDKDLAAEGLEAAATVTVFRNTDTAEALEITPASSDLSELVVPDPATRTIPAGADRVSFTIRTVQDNATDGNQPVTVTASAAGFTAGSDTIVISDIDLPDLVVSSIVAPAETLTEQYFDVTYRIANQGLLAAVASNATAEFAGSWTDRVFLSSDAVIGDDTLIGNYVYTGTMPVGLYFNRTVPARSPLKAGDYWVVVTTDLGNTVNEGLETNNTRISAAPIHVLPAYSATVAAGVDVAPAGTPVRLTGHATKTDTGAPAPFAMVNIHLIVRGTQRVISALANEAGDFSATFTPLPGEGGRYSVFATHPGVDTADEQDTFVIQGMRAEPPKDSAKILEGGSAERKFTIRNLSDVALNGLTATVVSAPANLTVTVTPADLGQLGGLATRELTATISANDASVAEGTVVIRVTSTEGVSIDVPIDVQVEALRPRLLPSVGLLQAAMFRGQQRAVEFSVTNQGGRATGAIAVELPNAPWLSLSTPATIPSLAPGQSATVTLLLTPAADLELTAYNGNVLFRMDGAELSVPFTFRAVSDGLGDLVVTVVDEYFYYAEGAPKVAGATVVLRDAVTGAEVASGVTDGDGKVSLPRVQEGYYTLEARAADHDTYASTIFIAAGQLNVIQAFISRQTVKYVWTVKEVEIEDRTRITIESVFETNVPAPVVTIDPPLIDLAPLTAAGQSMQIDMTVENHGLIAAQAVALYFGSHPMYRFTPLVEDIGLLPAKSSLTIPVLIERVELPAESADADGLGDPANGPAPVPCSIPASLKWSYPCGPQDVTQSTGIAIVNVDAECPGGGVGRGHGLSGLVGWGVGGPGHVTPVVFELKSNCKCDPTNFESRDLVTIDILSFFKPVEDAANSILSLTAGAMIGVAPEYDIEAKGGVRTCCRPDGTVGVEFFGTAGASGGLRIGQGVDINASVNWGVISAEGKIQAGEFVTPEVYGEGEITSGCGGDPTVTFSGGFRIKQFSGVGGSVDVSAGMGPINVPITGGGFGDEETVVFDYRRTISASVGGAPTAAEALAEVQEALASSAGDPNGFIQAMEGLPGEFRWSYFSKGAYYSAFFDYDGKQWSLADDPTTPEVETTAFLVKPYENLAPNNDTLSALVNWTPEEAEARGIFAMPLEDLLAVIKSAAGGASPDAPQTPAAAAGDAGVCAQVRLRIEQEAVMTRTAFGATLELVNNSADVPLENVDVDVTVFDDADNVVNQLFGIRNPQVSGLSAVDGTGRVEPHSTGSASWIVIPTDAAAPQVPTQYHLGGLLRYTVNGRQMTVPLESVAITVRPDAALDLTYFHQRDVFSDDPHTEEIEPAQPFELAVMVQNKGAGAARNLRIESAQPEIIENEKGLLIDFQIIASEVAGQNLQPTLTANFGNVDPGQIKVGRWWLTSTLQGQFIDYKATFEHIDGLGDPRLSLIKNVSIHELIHTARAYGDLDDGMPDFLVNDVPDPEQSPGVTYDIPDTLYLSDGSVEIVGLATNPRADGAVTPGDMTVTLSAEMAAGWSYMKLSDPGGADYRVKRVVRSDGVELPAENFGQTDRTFIENGKRPIYENNLHLLDLNGTGSYTLTYERRDQTGPVVAALESPDDVRIDPLASLEVTFSEAIQPGSFNWEDLTLTRDGGTSLITGAVTIDSLGGAKYRINGLAGLTAEDGQYVLSVSAAGVADLFDNAGSGSRSASWNKVADTPGIVSLVLLPPISSDFRNTSTAVEAVEVTFTEPIQSNTLGQEDFTLTRDGDVNLIDASFNPTITQIGPQSYRVAGWNTLTAAEGVYRLTASAAGVQDLDAHAGQGEASVLWTMDTTAPSLASLTGAPAATNTPVDTLLVQASEPLGVFDYRSLSLTRNGGANLITSAVRVQATAGNSYRISGVGALAAADGQYQLTVNGANVADRAGNAGSGAKSASWVMDTVAPAAPSGLAISPDTGISA
ncbi:MAG: CARDB domain-containing protein, partial [Pirellulales bacterium]